MKNHYALLIPLLKEKGVSFEKGLSELEFTELERQYEIRFPADLKAFLTEGLPVSDGFVNWREALTSPEIREVAVDALGWPLEGMLFDVEKNNFWREDWGAKPDELDKQFEIAKQHFKNYPKMIPVYSHRYMPSRPETAGNPVFSVYQTDIIFYGYTLPHYLAFEFKFDLPTEIETPTWPPREVETWTELCQGSAFSEWWPED
jgi:hypothetical protein